jgi:hypothetical protein
MDHRFFACLSMSEVGSQSFEILRLRSCEVVVLDTVAAVAIEDCEGCRVFVGPCGGAVNIRNCKNCVFTLVTNHLIIKGSSQCIFTSFAQNGPAIEMSTGLTFGPLNGSYPQLNQHARAAGLPALSEANNRILDVVDFSQGSTELSEAIHWAPLDIAEWDWDSPPSSQTERRLLTPIGTLTVAALLDRYDVDGDAAWNFAELNAYQAATGDDDRVAGAPEMALMLTAAGIPLDADGLLRFQGELRIVLRSPACHQRQ